MCVWDDGIRCRPLKITHTPHNGDADSTEDPQITKERERLIQKFGEKRLRRIIAKYQRRKREAEQRQREQWIRDQFRISSVCNKHATNTVRSEQQRQIPQPACTRSQSVFGGAAQSLTRYPSPRLRAGIQRTVVRPFRRSEAWYTSLPIPLSHSRTIPPW